MRPSLKDRLSNHSMPEPNSGCLLWLGCIDDQGYGRLGKRLAHRLSWEAHRGPIPRGLMACHKCDVPGCINPDHIFLGTHADNMADKGAKGRVPRGEGQTNAKLNDGLVLAIRADMRPSRKIAAEYGIARSLVSMIKTGRRWSHVQ